MGTRRDRARKVPYSFYADRGIAHLNARINGKRHRPSLGLAYDPERTTGSALREIEEAAAREYAKLVEGRVLDGGPAARVLTAHTFEELGDLWLEEAKTVWPKSYKTRTTQLTNVLTWAMTAKRFADDKRTPFERIVDDAGPEQFAMDRLAAVVRDTVTKEITNLFTFFAWALRERHIAAIPKRPKLPDGAKGTRSGPQRERPVDITIEQAMEIIALMPEWSVRGGRGIQEGKPLPKKAFRVRDVFRLSWELALRPGDIQTLSVPRHWMPGQSFVFFLDDKTESEDRIPLTDAAREILERCAPEGGGLIFGRHDMRNHVKAAALKVLPKPLAAKFAAYDFRHGRASDALEKTGDLQGTSFLLRHRQLTTTNRYTRPRQRHAERMVAALNELESVSDRSGTLTNAADSSEVSALKTTENTEEVRRRGLEPLRCYPLAPQGGESEGISDVSTGVARQDAPQSATDPGDSATPGSGSGQDGPPPVLLDLKRALIIETSVWDAFDILQLREMGIELAPKDEDDR